MSSASLTEPSTTIEILSGTGKCVVDTMTLEFQGSLGAFSSIEKAVGREVVVSMRGREFPAPELSSPDCSLDPGMQNGGMHLDDFLAQALADPAVAASAKKIRQKVGRAKKRNGLAKLRLQAGLSQADLAPLMDTQQSAIARWEANPTTMSHQNMRKLAKVLGCSTDDVFQAIEVQCNAAEHTHVTA